MAGFFTLQPALDFLKWLTSQTKDKILFVILSIVIAGLCYENKTLNDENAKLYNNDIVNNRRADSIRAIYEKRVQDCNDRRQEDLVKATSKYEKRVEKLEERLYGNHKTIK